VQSNKMQPARRTAREWARLVEAWKKSGKTAGEFAASRGLQARTLTWWRWRLAAETRSVVAAPLRLVPVRVEPSAATTPPSSEATPVWEIITARGHLVRVHRGISGAEIGAVLAALELAEAGR
jgi:transposase